MTVAPYDRSHYRYSRSLEPRIAASMGQVYGPDTGRCFGGTGETDIEHMVAMSEAHDSGLCAAPAEKILSACDTTADGGDGMRLGPSARAEGAAAAGRPRGGGSTEPLKLRPSSDWLTC